VNGFASLLELAGLCIGRRPAATALKEADIADPSFIDELEKSGFIDQLYAAYRPLPALSGSPSSKSEASGFAPFSDVVLRISRDVVASTNATVARSEWRPCSWRYSRQSKRACRTSASRFVLIRNPLFSNNRNMGRFSAKTSAISFSSPAA